MILTPNYTLYGTFSLYDKSGTKIFSKYGSCSQDVRMNKSYSKIECFFAKKFLSNFFNEEAIKVWIDTISEITPVKYNGEYKLSETGIVGSHNFKAPEKNYGERFVIHLNDTVLKFTIEVPDIPGSNLLGYTTYCLVRYLFWAEAQYIPFTYVFDIYNRSILSKQGVKKLHQVISPFKLIQICHFINNDMPTLPRVTGLYGSISTYSNLNKFVEPISLEEFKEYISKRPEYINGGFFRKGFSNRTVTDLMTQLFSGNLTEIKKIINE